MQTSSSRWKEPFLTCCPDDMISCWQVVTCQSQDLTDGIMSGSKSLPVPAFISTHISSQKLRHTLEVTIILQPHQISKEEILTWRKQGIAAAGERQRERKIDNFALMPPDSICFSEKNKVHYTNKVAQPNPLLTWFILRVASTKVAAQDKLWKAAIKTLCCRGDRIAVVWQLVCWVFMCAHFLAGDFSVVTAGQAAISSGGLQLWAVDQAVAYSLFCLS